MSEDEIIPYNLAAPAPVRMEIRPGWAQRLMELAPRGALKDGAWQEANPHRLGACAECGAYRTDGRPPYIHKDGCPHEGDLQTGRWLAEQRTGDHGGPVLYCTEHDHVTEGPGA